MQPHSSAPVRDAVAAAPAASSASAQKASTPSATDAGRRRRPPPPGGGAPCVRATHQASAQAPMHSSVACWLRWRRLPMATPCVEG